MSAESEDYLAVLKASYDYDLQSEDEVSMKEGQILFLIEKTDEDWWKVKIKPEASAESSPVGLVPAAYVEQAEHTAVVKALYDYDATAAGELSIKEDEVLLAFDQEDDWLLVQSREGGKAGFVPINYVEDVDSEAPTPAPEPEIVIPESPTKPTSTPEDLVKATRANADDIQTWAVSEVDKKNKKKKGTLGVGNGAIFFASESDKTPVQKWQTAEIEGINIEKSKHIHIDIGGSNPLHLHFNAGSKDTAEAIVAKIISSKRLSTPSSSQKGTTPATTPAQTRRLPPDDGKFSKKKASVHFSASSPEMIPPHSSSEPEDLEPENEPQAVEDQAATEETGQIVTAVYDFDADREDELSVKAGEQLTVLQNDGDDWWTCRNAKGAEGLVPAPYLEVTDLDESASVTKVDDLAEKKAQERAELERQRAEEVRRQRAEDARQEREKSQREREEAAAEREREEGAAAQRERAEAIQRELQMKADRERAEKQRKETELEHHTKASPTTSGSDRNRPQDPGDRRSQRPKSSNTHSKSSSSRSDPKSSSGASNRGSKKDSRPSPENTRIWHDRTGQFRVEAAFVGSSNGKIKLHKVNGVIVEVPSEKMSLEDIQYVEKFTSNSPGTSSAKGRSEDDVPLANLRPDASRVTSKSSSVPKKGPPFDWFEFFLSAGCDIDDCTRYASAFDRDKIDEAILPDITDATMRSLGLREGDIIRVTKVIQQRKPKELNGKDLRQDQLWADEELARQLQAEENAGSSSAPNIFAGPQGALKNQRRGRPQPSKSTPPSAVDLDAISSASDQMKRVTSPQISPSPSAPVQPPPRSSSALPANGFDDDAWTNRPSSAKQASATSPVTSAGKSTSPAPAATTPAVAAPPAQSTQQLAQASSSLGKTTEADIFQQIAKLNAKGPPTPVATTSSPPIATAPSMTPVPVIGYVSGLGMGSSPIPIGQHIQNQQTGILPPVTGPRGPFAPVPANQTLLQPLIPATSSFNNFVPTRPSSVPSSFQTQPLLGTPQSQLQVHAQTGYAVPGFSSSQPLLPQATGIPLGGFGPSGFLQPNPTGFNPVLPQPSYLNAPPVPPIPPMPPLPTANSTNDISPANVFAQMKSGTFASGDEAKGPQSSDKYDALRPAVIPQPTGWVFNNGLQQSGFTRY